MEPFSAKDARERAIKFKVGNSQILQAFFQWVKYRSEDGEYSGNFSIPNYAEDFTDQEFEWLRYELGYKMRWNSACQWYEVEW